ncbi:PAPA-1-like conserved region-domain-containing protein [Neurospora tetraspora]|uniref:PAPA-1-like conserved region-domain-containing protein n=1 Tax=Neurospora tetraspora TaxID=94610 RepID=A0AAE0JFY5_9PEZI|nr:PAPA-1-like conserved region-domain-containing protein [Neurospora tetraspora]
MSSRPRRSAAQRATALITDLIHSDRVTPERTMSSSRSTTARRPPSSPASSRSDANGHNMLTVKVPSNKLREATSGNSSSGIAASRRNRPGAKKSYVVESSEDEDEEMEEEEDDEEVEEADEIEVSNNAPVLDDDEDDEEDEEEEDDEDEDMDVDEDDDVDMDDTPAPPTITVSKAQATTSPNKAKATAKAPSSSPTTIKAAPKTNYYDDDDDDDELSELESEPEDPELEDMAAAEDDAEEAEEEEDEDMDAEGDEIEVAEDDAEAEEVELDSDEEGGSRGGTPDISKMTARQRAKVGVASHEYMKLSDEVQAKKVFTAEELSMRRAEMARRRRNLSEKRNEEVKMETINKLLKKQAPKTNRKAALLNGDETPAGDAGPPKADPTFVRWINNKSGSRIAVPEDMLAGPVGQVFTGGVKRKMVEEVS